jgi:para-nitrobenzyl esterase
VSSSRQNVIRIANNKLAQGQPVYLAWFNWYPHIFDGLPRAFHCLDISFWFNNTDLMYSHSGGGKRPRDLADKMGDALEAFMRTGDPNCDALPAWPKYTPENGEVMILDDVCRVENDPDRPARSVLMQ